MKRRWRDYTTAGGRRPVKEFVWSLSAADRRAIAQALAEVRTEGLRAARHLRGDIWEVRASGDRQAFRVLFAPEGRRGQVLLALDGFSKKTRRTPPPKIRLAERRLADWRSRGRSHT